MFVYALKALLAVGEEDLLNGGTGFQPVIGYMARMAMPHMRVENPDYSVTSTWDRPSDSML